MSVRFKFCLLAWIAVVAIAVCTDSVSGQDLAPMPLPESALEVAPPAYPAPQPYTEVVPRSFAAENWQMNIRPAQKVQPAAPVSTVTLQGAPVDAAAYARIFASIPFNRAAYNANPNYQHDSTMEILTGNARHQTIVRHSTTRGVRPTQTVPAGFSYGSRRSQFGYFRPLLRSNGFRSY